MYAYNICNYVSSPLIHLVLFKILYKKQYADASMFGGCGIWFIFIISHKWQSWFKKDFYCHNVWINTMLVSANTFNSVYFQELFAQLCPELVTHILHTGETAHTPVGTLSVPLFLYACALSVHFHLAICLWDRSLNFWTRSSDFHASHRAATIWVRSLPQITTR